MNEWQVVVLEELKSINRKLERLEDNFRGELSDLEGRVDHELEPIKKHVTQVRFTALLISIAAPLLIGAWQLIVG